MADVTELLREVNFAVIVAKQLSMTLCRPRIQQEEEWLYRKGYGESPQTARG